MVPDAFELQVPDAGAFAEATRILPPRPRSYQDPRRRGASRPAQFGLMNIRENKALFLDRDGVINAEQGYVHCRRAFHFQDGIFDLCRAAQALGYVLLVATNQAGIARGYYTESKFLELTGWMIHKFAEQQIRIARVYYCPYHPIHGIGRYKYDSPDRKPKPGMLLRAGTDFNLDLMSSVLIGDKLSDIYAAKAAGVGTRILLRSGAAAIEMEENQCYSSNSLDDIRHRFFSPRSPRGESWQSNEVPP